MKKSSKFSKDFPTRKNHYAIRKFTVGTASIIVGSFLFFGQTQAHAEEFERVTTGTVDTGGQPARADQGQEGPQAGADTHNTASQPGVTGQDAPNENHAGDQNAAVTHPANQENNAPQAGAGTPGAENTPQAGGENHNQDNAVTAAGTSGEQNGGKPATSTTGQDAAQPNGPQGTSVAQPGNDASSQGHKDRKSVV